MPPATADFLVHPMIPATYLTHALSALLAMSEPEALSGVAGMLRDMGLAPSCEELLQTLADLHQAGRLHPALWIILAREAQDAFRCHPTTCGDAFRRWAPDLEALLELALSQPTLPEVLTWLDAFKQDLHPIQVQVGESSYLHSLWNISVQVSGLRRTRLWVHTETPLHFDGCPDLEAVTFTVPEGRQRDPFPIAFRRCPRLEAIEISGWIQSLAIGNCPKLQVLPSHRTFQMEWLALRGPRRVDLQKGDAAPAGLVQGGTVLQMGSKVPGATDHPPAVSLQNHQGILQ